MNSWRLRDLVTDHKTGKLRETAVWSNIGKATMTVAFAHEAWVGTLTEWFVVAYGGLVILHEATSRMLNQRQQGIDKQGDRP